MYRTLRRASLIVSALFAAACGSSTSPLTPAPAAVPITPTVITLSGHATATSSRQALGGLAVDFGGRRTETDGAGNFQYQLASNAVARLVLTGSAIVPRSVLVSVAVSRDLNVDAIALAGFDLTFYRQLVRNGTETPTGLEPLRRWTENPQFYLRTVDDAGTALDIQTLDRTEAVIRETVPIWTNRTFPGTVERGTSTKDGVADGSPSIGSQATTRRARNAVIRSSARIPAESTSSTRGCVGAPAPKYVLTSSATSSATRWASGTPTATATRCFRRRRCATSCHRHANAQPRRSPTRGRSAKSTRTRIATER